MTDHTPAAWTPEAEQRLHQLTAAAIDGRLAEADQAELQALLAAHPEARRAFLTQMDIESMLRGREYRVGKTLPFAPPEAATEGSSANGAPTTHNPQRFGRGWSGWAAAVLVAAIGLAVWSWNRPEAPSLAPEVIAHVEGLENARWGDVRDALIATPGGSRAAAQQIGLGQLELAAGVARLSATSDIELTLQAPCLVEFLNARTVKVHHGRLTAKVNGDTAIGFRVQTPTADVVDLGTEFGVLVEGDGSSEVHVFQGVVVARPLGAELVVPIYRHEAGRVAMGEASVTRAGAEPMTVYRPASLLAVPARPELFGQPAPVSAVRRPGREPLPRDARVLFIGDSFLDNGTSLQLVEQAWHDSGWKPAPRLLNGFVPDWIHQYTKRLEHHVFRFRPTHVVIAFGPQYAWQPADRITPEKFGADLNALIDALAAQGIESLLATAYRFRATNTEAQTVLDGYNAEVRRIAQARGLRLADIDRRFAEADALDSLVDTRGWLASFESERLVAAAWLEAFGQGEIAVPSRLDLRLFPGIVADWQFQLLPPDRPALTSEVAAQLTAPADWQRLHLPQVDRFTPRLAEPSHSHVCRERANGFATHLTTGTHPIWRGVANVTSPAERAAFVHVGGGVRQVWLNGELVFDDESTLPSGHGYHAGYEWKPVQLKAGDNRLVIECSGAFFVSINDSPEQPRRELD